MFRTVRVAGKGALLPRLVPADRLVATNSLNTLNDNAARLIGPPAGGFLIGIGGVMGVRLGFLHGQVHDAAGSWADDV